MPTKTRIVPAALALAIALSCAPASIAVAAGSISSSPNPLGVCVNGSGSFKVMHGGATVTITAASNSSPSVATVSPASVASGSNFTASGLAVGTTTIGLTDTSSGTGSETINVNGPISVTAGNSLTFDGTLNDGSGTTFKTFTVLDPTPPAQNTTVTATLPSSPVIASFSGTSTVLTASQVTSNGQTTFKVFPIGSAAATTVNIGLTDASNCALTSAVSVTVKPGTLSLSTANLNFTALGSANNQTFTAQDYNYTGTLTATTPTGNNTVTVTPPSTPAPGAGNTALFTVTPNTYGKSTVTVSDSRTSKNVSVLVSGGTITIPGSKTAAFGTVNDNTNQFLAATALRVTGSMESTTTGGADVYVMSPSDIIGSSGDLLKISYLTYNCTSNDSTKNQGGTFASGHVQLIANAAASDCLSFGNAGGTGQFADLDFNVNLFLDDRTVPADTYNTATGRNSQFTVVLSAT